MADIKITFEEVKQKAADLRNYNTLLDENLKDIQTKINSLDAQWESDSSATIRAKITNMSAKFKTYYEIIESYAQFLVDTATKYSDTEATINNNASLFE